MNGAGKKLWGYDKDNDIWVPLQVDANGLVKVDMTAVNLDDLGDVSVASPTDQYFLYWNDAASLWECRALVDGDIPASICRDAEAVALVAAEAAARNAAIAAVVLDDLADVNVPTPTDKYYLQYNDATSLWIAVQGYEFGPEMPLWQNEADFFHWTVTLTGSGANLEQNYGTLRLKTGTTAGSTARGRGFGFGWIDYATMDFQWFTSVYARAGAAGTQKWYKIDSDTSGDPTTYAIGWREDSNALKGIVHDGTSLHVIDLGVTLTLNASYNLFLNLIHGSKVEWYVNGVKKGESTDIPAWLKASLTYCVISVQNNAVVASAEVHLHQHSFIQRYV